MKKFTGIVKIQRPLFNTSGDMNELLIYDKDGTIETILPVDDATMEQIFPHDELKTYWRAEGKDGGMLNLIEQVEEQDW